MGRQTYNTILAASATDGLERLLEGRRRGPSGDLALRFRSALRRLFRDTADFRLLDTEPGLTNLLDQVSSYLPTAGDSGTASLVAVASRVDLGQALPSQAVHIWGELSPTNVFPKSGRPLTSTETDEHLVAMVTALEELCKVSTLDFDVAYSHLMAVLLRFAWCIPINPATSDVSWYDYLHLRTAVSAALYHCRTTSVGGALTRETPPFRLVVGDLSGIQRYIFEISHTGAVGVAKRLRARSFYLAILAEAISHRILHAFDLPLSNILIASGGKFYLLVPNTPDSERILVDLACRLDRWFVARFGGDLAVHLAHIALDGTKLANFPGVMARAGEALAEKKARPLSRYLAGEDGWRESHFIMPVLGSELAGNSEALCPGCGKRPREAEGPDGLCSCCQADLSLGAALPHLRDLAFFRDSGGQWELFDGYSFGVWEQRQSTVHPYLVERLNSTVLCDLAKWPVAFRFLANYVPLDSQGIPRDFDDIASSSTGTPLLGYLKADVDHLGSAFVFGLSLDQHDTGNLARTIALSRALELFFAGWIDQLLESVYPNCYTVFSGGDDLFVVGPWDQMLDVAREIQAEFTRLVGGNPNLTLSAGVAVVKPRLPVSSGAAFTNESLDQSKETVVKGSDRNQITLFGQALKWPDFDRVLGWGKDLADWLRSGALSSAFVHRLFLYDEMFQLYARTGDARGLRFLPLLTYDIARNLLRGKQDDSERERARRWAESLKDLSNPGLPYLGLAAQYAITANRRNRNGTEPGDTL